MFRKPSNSSKKGLLQLQIALMMLLVLLNSCAVKGSIRALATAPANLEHHLPKTQGQILSHADSKCAQTELSDKIVAHHTSIEAHGWLPILFALWLFPGWRNSRLLVVEESHPKYNNSSKIGNWIPLFLVYRRIRIPSLA